MHRKMVDWKKILFNGRMSMLLTIKRIIMISENGSVIWMLSVNKRKPIKQIVMTSLKGFHNKSAFTFELVPRIMRLTFFTK